MSEEVKSSTTSLVLLPRWNQVAGLFALILTITGIVFLNEHGIFGSRFQLLSPFRIQELKINSEWPVSNSEIETWLPSLKGKSLLSLKGSDLVASLEQRPWIEHVTVKKQFPDRLWIDVETKRPRALSVVKGTIYFVDANGNVIDRARPKIFKNMDLPFLSNAVEPGKWKVSEVLSMAEIIKSLAHSKFSFSQIILLNYPYLKIFFEKPQLEVHLSMENWQSQSKILETFLLDPPSQVEQLQRINLIFPKKAVVSTRN